MTWANQSGTRSFALHRAELHAMLLESAKGARLCADRRVRGIKLGKRPVVRFDDKSGVGEDAANLVIGADGLESAARKAIFPDHPGLRYADYVTWRAVVPAEAAPPSSLDADPARHRNRAIRRWRSRNQPSQAAWRAA